MSFNTSYASLVVNYFCKVTGRGGAGGVALGRGYIDNLTVGLTVVELTCYRSSSRNDCVGAILGQYQIFIG